MPIKLENVKELIATDSTEAALLLLSAQIGVYPIFIKAEFDWLAARWAGLQRQAKQGKITAKQSLEIIQSIQTNLASLVENIENQEITSLHDIGDHSEAVFQLTFISARQRVHYPFHISPHQSLGYLKKSLIKRFKIDTTAPPDADNPETYLVVNRIALLNDGLSLLEAGIKDQDIVQINVQYHKKMVWNQSVPTRLCVTFVGRTFEHPSLIINNKQKAKIICLTETELEVEFYTYEFTATVKDLIFHFRFIDGKVCLEFQEVLNAKGKTIDLGRIGKQFALDRG